MFNTIIAYAEGQQAQVGNTMDPGIFSIISMVLIFVLMYWIMIRPQKKQQKEMQNMLNSLEVGDKVVTIGGICGKIAKIKDDKVWVITGKNVDEIEKCCIQFEKSAIKSVDKKIQE